MHELICKQKSSISMHICSWFCICASVYSHSYQIIIVSMKAILKTLVCIKSLQIFNNWGKCLHNPVLNTIISPKVKWFNSLYICIQEFWEKKKKHWITTTCFISFWNSSINILLHNVKLHVVLFKNYILTNV